MISSTINACKKHNKRKSGKIEIIRPAQGGMVQYYSPEDVGQSRAESVSASSSSSDSSSIRSTCSHGQQCQHQLRKSSKSSSKKSSFSWREGWHPGRKDDDEQAWRGGWPGSENVEGWRAHMSPVQSTTTSTDQWQSWYEVDAARVAEAARMSTRLGCGQVNPESPSSVSSSGWDHFLRDVKPPAYDATTRYEME